MGLCNIKLCENERLVLAEAITREVECLESLVWGRRNTVAYVLWL